MKTKSEERRQHIMNVADEAFRELGFEAASMAIISARVGGSKATLYNYFSTKEELFVEIMLSSARKHCHSAFEMLDDVQNDREILQKFAIEYMKFVTSPEVLEIRRMTISQALRSNIGKMVYERGIKVGWGKVSDFMTQCMDKKIFIKSDPWVMAMHLKGILEAGTLDPCLLGVDVDTSPAKLKKSVGLALDAFYRAYAVTP